MNYRLQVITHSGQDTLPDTLASFEEMVTPVPDSTEILNDDGDLGFCQNTRRSWQSAASSKADFVFWLEHDFRFIRPLDLRPLAAVLEENPRLAQMALIRNAVNEQEKAAGGWLQYHSSDVDEPYVFSFEKRSYLWYEHGICLTTNPSLLRREFMVSNPWPDYSAQCEGRFSENLRQRGYRFAHWSSEEHVKHTGKLRTGHGY